MIRIVSKEDASVTYLHDIKGWRRRGSLSNRQLSAVTVATHELSYLLRRSKTPALFRCVLVVGWPSLPAEESGGDRGADHEDSDEDACLEHERSPRLAEPQSPQKPDHIGQR